MILYDFTLSGNCYKVRLLLSLLGLTYETKPVRLEEQEQKSPWFLRLNPRGQVPVLVDKEVVIWDSMAILVYLARRYGGDDWLPADAQPLACVMQWLALSQNEILYGLARARASKLFNRQCSLEECRAQGTLALETLEQTLRSGPWLVGTRPTVADISCYPYVVLAPEGGIGLEPFLSVRAWIARI